MTELQKNELDILRCFIDICETLKLRYYLVCGSALGAVKYRGFIPWDDDIDVALPRSDYEIFLKEAQKLMPEYYFLQTYITDPNYPGVNSKIRDSRTTYIEKSVKDVDMNHGVYIDVFPLDGYPENEDEIKKLEKKKHALKLRLSSANVIHSGQKLTTRLFFRAERILGCHRRTAKYAAKLDSLMSAYPAENSKLWCNHANWQGTLEYAPRAQYGEGKTFEFEGLKVIVPEQYDEYLTQKYGDWRADLPEEEQIGHHFYSLCDLHRPYTDYC